MARYEDTCQTCLFAKNGRCRLTGAAIMSIGGCYQHIRVWTAPRDERDVRADTREAVERG